MMQLKADTRNHPKRTKNDDEPMICTKPEKKVMFEDEGKF